MDDHPLSLLTQLPGEWTVQAYPSNFYVVNVRLGGVTVEKAGGDLAEVIEKVWRVVRAVLKEGSDG